MPVKINKRLLTISAFLKENSHVIDIGCDHGLLGIYLYQNHTNIRIVSSDINPKPLQIAYDNLVKYQLENKIELRLGNGLECLDKKIDTVIIAGMGGLTIIDILQNIHNYPMVETLIISPNNDFVLTRKKITQQGFYLSQEVMVKEHDKYYLVSVYTKKKSRYHYFFGKLDLHNEEVRVYYKIMYLKNTELLKTIPKGRLGRRIHLKIVNIKIKSIIKLKL